MNNKLVKIIEGLGLEDKEARVYLAALELGSSSVLEISRKANVERVNTYYVLGRLVQQGIAYESIRGKGKTYSAIGPKKLEELSNAKLAEYKSALPELLSIENLSETKPKIRFYEGVEGIKQAFNETLEVTPPEIILSVATASMIHEFLEEWVPKYLAKRIKRQIQMKAIVEDSDQAQQHKANDLAELRETRLVPKEKFPFKNEINIFGNKIMIASYRDQIAVIIESKDIADTQRAFFELAWEGAERYQLKN